MSLRGLKENALFGWPPREIGLCGLGDTPSILQRFLTTGNPAGVQDELSQFKNLPNQLQTIATELNVKDKFSLRVAQRYWLGKHNFQVLNSPGSDNLTAVNLCMIRSGKIIEINPDNVLVETFILQPHDKTLEIANIIQRINFSQKITGTPKVSQIVAFHWNKIVRPITITEEQVIIDQTKQAINQLR